MNFDLIIIGSGPGGYVVPSGHPSAGPKVRCVGAELGGVCLTGAVFYKIAVRASVYDYLTHAADYSITIRQCERHLRR
jgi:pyruvate/2-oxoglutarate dehydrogenase complex dihydrolipoamide dehydrogenase (E3) component